jgi:hypothetical protein
MDDVFLAVPSQNLNPDVLMMKLELLWLLALVFVLLWKATIVRVGLNAGLLSLARPENVRSEKL